MNILKYSYLVFFLQMIIIGIHVFSISFNYFFSSTQMLVMFKSAPILKSALKVRQGMFQYYVLKLIKTQTKFLGRQWRKSNMKILSDIYQKVRHHLNDDWAFGNGLTVYYFWFEFQFLLIF